MSADRIRELLALSQPIITKLRDEGRAQDAGVVAELRAIALRSLPGAVTPLGAVSLPSSGDAEDGHFDFSR